MTLLRKILDLLSPKEKRRGLLVLAMVVVMALLETIGVASVMPFLTVLGNPEAVETNPYLNAAYTTLGFESTDAFLMALGVAAFGLVIFAAAFRILTIYVMNRFAEMRRHSVGERLLETYLRQPYEFFLNRHSGDMAKSILSEVGQLVQNVFRPGFEAIAYGVVGIAIITMLVAIDPILALGVGTVIGGAYAIIFLSVKGILSRIGKDRAHANRERFTAAGEALGGIKDIKLLGREYAYLSRFRPSSRRFAKHQATNRTLSQAPKYLIESIGVGGILGLSMILMATGDGLGSVLPILGLYAFAGYKLLPAAQRMYAGASKLRFGAAAVHEIHDDLLRRQGTEEIQKSTANPWMPSRNIELREFVFHYPNTKTPALDGVSLDIPAGSSLGIVGGTGAGKTTLVDLILGLLRPTGGVILVDDEPITASNLRSWQKTIGYVPQEIFLTDATVAENIALGVPKEQIQHARVEESARLAQIHDFVIDELPHQYDSLVGERGVRISGGQRQRIGIARALYHDPSILVFDEATSALDSETESAVIQSIENLYGLKTILMIAHRTATVKKCSKVVRISGGRCFDEPNSGSDNKRVTM